jgi:beta-glucosidase
MTSRRLLGLVIAAATIGSTLALTPTPPAVAAGRCGNHPWCDTTLSPSKRADLLLAELTLDEKIGLLGGDDLMGGAFSSPDTHTGVQEGVPRLDLPTIYYSDGPVGPRQGKSIGLPAPLTLAATFDPELARSHGTVAASEAKAKGNDAIYAPTVNIARTPLGGRTFEGYGEDPLLTSRLGVAWIEGAQATGVIGNVKHFAANNQEGIDLTGGALNEHLPAGLGIIGTRYAQNSIVDDRTMREIYLPQFEAAVKEAKVGTIMCAYNRVNGTYACQNPTLLKKILRDEWGFKGYTIADYLAIHTTDGGLNNGLDFEPWPPVGYQPLLVSTAVTLGQVKKATIDEHVRVMLETWFRFGVFDRAAYRNDDAQIDKAADGQASQRIAEQSTTLLRNQGNILPISPSVTSIVVIGKPATEFAVGGGSGEVEPFENHSLLDGITARAGSGVKVTYDDGSDSARAATAAAAADIAIVVAKDQYGEGSDRNCLTLECPGTYGDQDALIGAVAASQSKTVVVLESGGADLTPWRSKIAALVQAWYPGAHGGPALARVLFGDVDPGGRLPLTIPDSESQLPTAVSAARYPGSGVLGLETHYDEGVFVGYRWYDEKNLTPAYPFGFGLSYTSFALSGLTVNQSGSGAVVTAVVKNTGDRTGYAVPQLYLGLPDQSATVQQPPAALKGFTKVQLAPGESRTVSFSLDERALSYWDAGSSAWKVTKGCAAVKVGSSSRDLPLNGKLPIGGGTC